jgi:branched-chain amino acid transport system permease protein
MTEFLNAYGTTIEHALIAASLALSQYVVLRAGVFSLAPAGIAAIGGYSAGIAVVDHGWSASAGMALAIVTSVAVSLVLGAMLSRLRGIFQGVATLGFVLVVQAVIIGFPDLTGGVVGTNGIPKVATTSILLVWLAIQILILLGLGRSKVLLIFDAIRSDEAAARSHGVNIYRNQLLAFAVSGLFAGVSGAMIAYNNYSVVPSLFSFQAMITILAGAVLGGLQVIGGPIVGALIYSLLPEIARPLANYREFVIGALLIVTIVFLPDGLVQRRFFRSARKRLRRGRTEAWVDAKLQPVVPETHAQERNVTTTRNIP